MDIKKIKINKAIIFILCLILIYLIDYNRQRIMYEKIDKRIERENNIRKTHDFSNFKEEIFHSVKYSHSETKLYNLFSSKYFPKIIPIDREIYKKTVSYKFSFNVGHEIFITNEINQLSLKLYPQEYKEDSESKSELSLNLKKFYHDIDYKLSYEEKLELNSSIATATTISINYPNRKRSEYYKKENGRWIVEDIFVTENIADIKFWRHGDKSTENISKNEIIKRVYFDDETYQAKEVYIEKDKKRTIIKYNVFGDVIEYSEI